MDVDYTKLLQNLLATPRASQLLNDKQKLASLINSPEGKQLISLLEKNSNGSVKDMIDAVSRGDIENLKNALNSLLSGAAGSELAKKITEKAKE